MAMPPLPGVGSDVSADPVGDPLDFNGAGEARGEVAELFGQRVREGGTDGITRFEALSRIIGYWIRRCRPGHATPAQAWQEISDYNAARIYPPWPEDRLRHESEQLWRRDSAQQDQRQTAGTDASGEAPSGPARGRDDDDLLPVGLVRADGDLDDLAREFEPTAQSIRNWIARADKKEGRQADAPPGLSAVGLDELSRPRRENKQLRVERDIRAKVAACFARDTVTLPSGSWGP